MLRSLRGEIMRRRLWPILLAAVVVAVGAPLLFLKSAPPDAPAVTAAAPAGAPEGKLPPRAQRLLAAGAASAVKARRPAARAADPFQPPASHRAAQADKQSGGSDAKQATSAAAVDPSKPVPVVITNATGTPTASATPPSPATPIDDSVTATIAKTATAVDVRFSTQLPGSFHRAIARQQTFVAGGRVIAIFVKYSPRRDKAVFAIAPKTLVSGDVECRRKEGVCRYVDIPAGEHVRLTTIARDGSLVSRRIDVVRIERRPVSAASATAASEAPQDAPCLLGKLLSLTAADAPLSSDACAR